MEFHNESATGFPSRIPALIQDFLARLRPAAIGAWLRTGTLRQAPAPDERYGMLGRLVADAILLLDGQGRILDINDAGLVLYGYRRDEIAGLDEFSLLAPGLSSAGLLPLGVGEGGAPRFYETVHRRKDGRPFPVEVREIVDTSGDEPRIHRLVRDIGAATAMAAHIARLSRLSVTLSAINHAITCEKSLDDVFAAACKACVEHGAFERAMIFRPAAGSDELRVAHAAGGEIAMPNSRMPETGGDQAPALCSTLNAFRLRRLCLCGGPAGPERCGTCNHTGMLGASASMPIEYDGAAVGVLTLYGVEVSSFDAHSKLLLAEMAESLSFAIHHFTEQASKRETEKALRHRETLLLRAEEVARVGHWEADLETGQRSWSPQVPRLFGLDPALPPPEDLEAFIARYLTPEAARLTRLGIRDAIVHGKRVQVEQQILLDDGRPAWHTTLIVPVRNDAGWTVALHGTVQDVTEHKLNEARLGKMANRLAQVAREYEDLYQNAPCGYHSIDTDGVFQRINETELRWLGYARNEVIGRMRYIDLLDAPSRAAFAAHFDRFVEAGDVRDLEQNLICRDGSLLPVLINATAIRDESGRLLMSRTTAYNMSERRKIEHEREEYARRLAHLSRHLVNMQEEERRRLSASLHDRTSPNLAAISLNLSTIAIAGAGRLPPELAEHLEDIRALVDDTTASIREISADLRPPLLDYAGLVAALESYLYQYSKRTGTTTRFAADLPERPPFEVESLLFRIVQEALTNCAKHARASLIEVGLRQDGERIVLDIRDDGAGFDPASLGHNGNKPGLGMLNMREMTEFAGGRFSLEAKPGEGTAIRVEI